MKKKYLVTIMFSLLAIGIILLLWGAIKMENYEGFREMRKEALKTVRMQYNIGLVCLVTVYVLTFIKGK